MTVGRLAVFLRPLLRRAFEARLTNFPLYDEKVDGRAFWHLDSTPFRHLEDRGFTLTQLCALYFSRTLVECLAGTPFQQDLQSAFDELGRTLPPRMREFFDRLPAVIASKPEPSVKMLVSPTEQSSSSVRKMTARYAPLRMKPAFSGREPSSARFIASSWASKPQPVAPTWAMQENAASSVPE